MIFRSQSEPYAFSATAQASSPALGILMMTLEKLWAIQCLHLRLARRLFGMLGPIAAVMIARFIVRNWT